MTGMAFHTKKPFQVFNEPWDTPKLFGDLTISIEATYQARQQPKRREKHLQMAAETEWGGKKSNRKGNPSA